MAKAVVCKMFDDMSIVEVVWDEELQHMFDDQHRLLKQLAQGGNYSGGEEKNLTTEPPTYDVLTHVSGSSCLLELGIEAVHGFDEIHLEDNYATIPDCVQFMDPVTSKGDVQEACDGTCPEGRATSLTQKVTFFYTSKLSECAAVEVLNEVSLGDVIWDKEVQHSPNSHGLLPPDDQESLDVEAMMPVTDQIISVANGSSSFLEYNQANTDQMSDEIPYEVVWDKEPLYNLEAHGDYLQQDSLYKEYWVGKDILVDQNGERHVCEASKLMIEAPMDELNIDVGTLVLLELGIASVNVLYDEVSQLDVACDDALLHNLGSQDELVQQEAQIDECLDVENKTAVDQAHCNDTFLAKFDTDSANKLFNNLLHEVVWDEEMSSSMSMHIDLLQQLAFGSKSTDCIETHSNQVNFKALIVPVGAAHPVFDGMCPKITWDVEMQTGFSMHEGLLKQLALGKGYMDEEKTSHMVELNASEVLTHVGDEMHANLGMDFGDISNFVNQVMVQATIHPGLPDQRLVMHSNLLEKSVWELNIEQEQKGTNFSNHELNYDSENLITWEQMQGYHELTPWRLNALSPRHYNTEIAWRWFSPWSKRTLTHKQQQLEIYRMIERQWDPGIHRPVLIHTKSVLIIGSFWRYASQLVVTATRGTSSYPNFVRAVTYLCDIDNMGKMEFSFLFDSYLIDLQHQKTRFFSAVGSRHHTMDWI